MSAVRTVASTCHNDSIINYLSLVDLTMSYLQLLADVSGIWSLNYHRHRVAVQDGGKAITRRGVGTETERSKELVKLKVSPVAHTLAVDRVVWCNRLERRILTGTIVP